MLQNLEMIIKYIKNGRKSLDQCWELGDNKPEKVMKHYEAT